MSTDSARGSDDLRADEEGGVLTLSIHRPQVRNALSLPLLGELAAALRQASTRNELRVVVLRGSAGGPFSAGYDLGALPDRALSVDEVRALHLPVRAVADAITACQQPVVAAGRVFVIGAALDLFAHCDLRVCEEGTVFRMPPAKFGFLYPEAGMRQLVAVAGRSMATSMLMLGEAVDAASALAAGLVQSVFSSGRFEDDVKNLGRVLAGNAPLALRATKRVLQRGESAPRAAENWMEIARCLNSQDVREGLAAFREKRRPEFNGR